jgi:hypothetical protein
VWNRSLNSKPLYRTDCAVLKLKIDSFVYVAVMYKKFCFVCHANRFRTQSELRDLAFLVFLNLTSCEIHECLKIWRNCVFGLCPSSNFFLLKNNVS